MTLLLIAILLAILFPGLVRAVFTAGFIGAVWLVVFALLIVLLGGCAGAVQ